MIIEKNNLISEESILANTMNQYFTSITKQLNLKASPQLREGEGDILHKQIETFMSNKLSNKFSGFCKNYNTQYCLTYMLEKWKNTLGKGKHVGTVFMDLSKAFDTINHDLLIAKLEAHEFLNNALLFMLSYLKNRSERVSINISFSTWEKIIAGVRQGSILGPLLFNIFLNDIFYFENRSFLSNYADDNVLYAFGSNLDEVKQNLSEDLLKLSEWFYENSMILNLEKCHYMCLGKDSAGDLLRFCGEDLVASELETVLGIQIDNKLNFESRIKSLCNKASQKLGALQRISNMLDTQKKNLLFNSILKSQFSYCPLVWMFCSRRSNSLVNNAHERALRIVHDDHNSSYSELLKTKNERTIHQQNINVLMKEIYKFENDLSPPLIDDMFQVRKINYGLRNFQNIANTKRNSVKMGQKAISYRARQLWNLVPKDIKDALSLSTFKKKINSWYFDSCPCRLCKTYIASVGFV